MRMHASAGDGAVAQRQSVEEELEALRVENAQLRHALKSRIVIEQAKGAVSVRNGTTPEAAFELMRDLARSQRRNMHEFAAAVVANGGRLDV